MPDNISMNFLNWKGEKVFPTQIGPGFYNKSQSLKNSEKTDVNYLNCDTWNITQLTIQIQ